MKRIPSVLAFLCLMHIGAPASAELVAWDDLIDQEAQTYEDPYLELAYGQLDDLRTVAVETARLEDATLSEDARSRSLTRQEEARARLDDAGIDADWLIAQRWEVAERRERAATAANAAVDGQTVTLGGFAIPAPADEDGTRVVYLVPERGMCSHVPPPNPNQMIRARVSGDWQPSMMHEPVRLSGVLTVEETNHTFNIVDGPVPMRASFVMTVSHVETIADTMASQPPAANTAWAEKIAERLKAAQEATQGEEDMQ